MNKFKKKINLYIPYIIMVVLWLSIIGPRYIAKAEPNANSADITAELCDTSEYTNGVQLTEAGATISGWNVRNK